MHINEARKRFENQAANLRIRKRDLDATLGLGEWLQTLSYFEKRCAYCQEPFSYDQLEHVVPLYAKVIGTTVTNCVPTCQQCNKRKGTRNVSYWSNLLLQLALPLKLPLDDFAGRVLQVRKELYGLHDQQFPLDI